MRQILRHDQAIGAHESFARGPDAFFAVGGEGDVGDAGVAAVEGPGGFAVADDEDAGGGHCFVSIGGKVCGDGGDEMVVIVRGRSALAVLACLFRTGAPSKGWW